MLKKPTVDIIVIGYNKPELDAKCLKSVVESTTYPYKFTYFNNYNSGFTLTQIWNKLINESKCEYICLLNNDAYPTTGWLTQLMESLLYRKSRGFIGPSTNHCHTVQKSIDTPEKAKKYKNSVVTISQHLSGFCLLFPRTIWKKLNGFDERYTLYGQESDFIDRAQGLGYECWWRQDAFVWHDGEASTKDYDGADLERQKAKKLFWSDRGKNNV